MVRLSLDPFTHFRPLCPPKLTSPYPCPPPYPPAPSVPLPRPLPLPNPRVPRLLACPARHHRSARPLRPAPTWDARRGCEVADNAEIPPPRQLRSVFLNHQLTSRNDNLYLQRSRLRGEYREIYDTRRDDKSISIEFNLTLLGNYAPMFSLTFLPPSPHDLIRFFIEFNCKL